MFPGLVQGEDGLSEQTEPTSASAGAVDLFFMRSWSCCSSMNVRSHQHNQLGNPRQYRCTNSYVFWKQSNCLSNLILHIANLFRRWVLFSSPFRLHAAVGFSGFVKKNINSNITANTLYISTCFFHSLPHLSSLPMLEPENSMIKSLNVIFY